MNGTIIVEVTGAMRLRTISCYLYDSEATAFLLQGVIRYVHARRLMNVILQKSWTFGFHVKISFPAAEADNGLEPVIRRLAERYGKPRERREYAAYEEILHKLAVLENYTEAYLPLFKDGTVTAEETEGLLHGNTLGSSRVNYEIELLKSQLLVDLYDTWGELPEDRQNIECAKMFMITVNRSPGGIKFGYLSLRSNFEYFISRMEVTGKKEENKRRIWEALFSRTEEEQQFILQGVKRFAEGRYDREFIFGRLQIFVDCLLSVLSQGYDEGEIKAERLRTGGDFLQRYDALNDFHWTFHSPSELQKHQEKNFILYRIIDSVLYALMSLLQVTSVRKQHISGLVAECVEQGFSMNWRDSYLEMNLAQHHGEASEKMIH
ncbi:hypothetical protein [Paenibacillus albidus]|nr:hypothetical protein [Paenibacillus albidus]